jgi:hypothetical protein
LKDVDQGFLACQTAFAIEKEIPKASISRPAKRSCLADSREGAVHVVRFTLLSSDPSQDFGWRMTTIFPFLVREVLLEIVIQDPLFVHRHEILPRLSRFKIPVSHPSLHINYVELILKSPI